MTSSQTDTKKGTEAEDASQPASAEGRRREAPTADKPSITPPSIPDRSRTQPDQSTLANRKPGLASARHKRPVRQVAVTAIVRLRLDDRGTLRGTSAPQAGERDTIRLTRVATRLDLKLPRGSVAGVYQVSIQGHFGERFLTSPARSNDGKSLRVTMDLGALAPKNYYLCLQRRGELPDCNSVAIVDDPVKK